MTRMGLLLGKHAVFGGDEAGHTAPDSCIAAISAEP
jgi:hypothetical protein